MIWRNLNASNSTIYSVFREPSKELAEPLGSAEPRLKNTVLHHLQVQSWLAIRHYSLLRRAEFNKLLQGSLLSTFYEHLLGSLIPIALSLGSAQLKAAHQMLAKSTPDRM